MIVSLNEIEAMAKRATRGAGHPWGFAEEAGKAARWLAGHGLGGAEQLAALLTENDGAAYGELVPISGDGVWRAGSGRLSPLIAGAALSDRASEIAAGREINIGPIAFPLLLAPYAAAAARLTGATFELTWAGVEIILALGGVAIETAGSALTAPWVESVRCRRSGRTVVVRPAGTEATTVDAGVWSQLGALAHRTYAPASEASRIAGAGAGLTDND